MGRKERKRKGMTGRVGVSVREGGEKELGRGWAGLAWEGEVGRQGGGGAGLKGKRGRKKMWSRLERDEYRFARELWSPKSFRERERESLGPRWT
jgi:hypothetical protein